VSSGQQGLGSEPAWCQMPAVARSRRSRPQPLSIGSAKLVSSAERNPQFASSAFKEFGLPKAIRTDNGVPFASPHALFGLSKLAVWWLRLGIGIERIKPGHPEQNGRHERMHLTLKKEATKPAANNFLQQQAKFDDFIECFNHERPHQALNMKYPAELYRRSPHPYRGLSELKYPLQTAPSQSPNALTSALANADTIS